MHQDNRAGRAETYSIVQIMLTQVNVDVWRGCRSQVLAPRDLPASAK